MTAAMEVEEEEAGTVEAGKVETIIEAETGETMTIDATAEAMTGTTTTGAGAIAEAGREEVAAARGIIAAASMTGVPLVAPVAPVAPPQSVTADETEIAEVPLLL